VLNAFAFEIQPRWQGSPPVPMGKLRNTAELPWLMEASDFFGDSIYIFDGIYYEPYHTVISPNQLATRVTMSRHGKAGSNVLFADGHVALFRAGQLRLEMMDDGVRQR
jgi:prepilin-type processing-associated H-X9-DG protein